MPNTIQASAPTVTGAPGPETAGVRDERGEKKEYERDDALLSNQRMLFKADTGAKS
ncbi:MULTISPECIES: hypothetical protein [unclassified Massilia]|uniref:hypothetical protein n=1 Tax=unclassified Massilia TaxID=2609279 RepID=UPI00177CEC0E|nr:MULTISPECIES: hypothetical protein [unclassified Massilia]MBD8530931.1 hypothetical protein [Massilia sp. CFBP 13647]MBD8674656.1 hypothetical protein [Massilia sp. CFBP 13721]